MFKLNSLTLKLGALGLLGGTLALTSGCGSNSQASNAQTPPPPSLSAPVRSVDSQDSSAPVETASARSVGSSQPLPAVQTPAYAPAPAPSPMVSSTPSPSASLGGKVYVLQKGDTLYGVARKYGVSPKALIAANNFQDPNHLAVGTKVQIP